ncbi:MAG: hypothetical protein AUH86_05140 [Acidobacteria bacterium 13_1_40CM_4_58_4]|nr:MAG: hypothetical protein AUH86_05140 [Acidobacteria bacterium 13_1_40CM_4_58_4]
MLQARQSSVTAFAMSLAAEASHFGCSVLRWRRICFKALRLPRWIFAVSHSKKQSQLVTVCRQNAQFNTGTVRRQPPDDPVTAQVYEGIRIAYCSADDRLVHDFCRAFLSSRPVNGGRYQGLGFACDSSPVALGDGDQAQMPQAPQAGDTPRDPVIQTPLRHEMLEGILRTWGNVTGHFRQTVHLLPEMHRIAQFAGRDLPQPLIFFL